ncbi:Panacea domain-containing protein [Mycoplasma sp. Ms02]|uniref:Panacea domain-containing protein n=1 Tax=Mycoplasma sp. Ms02 TaxID=353851 RepID=UPI001C8A8354|nr:type II toxin-antitoxin system antitoxin SocA domain-containing protein [Mycoplasma sp. Ms02]QZE12353.1 DUF4065 domain-containing protein [Mycoplasma sp. Ms02]
MKSNQYSYKDVAMWFLNKEPMTQRKLQKLCFYVYAWSLTLLDYSIIKDTKFQAWEHGPVSPELYEDYKFYGWRDIPKNENIHIKFDEKAQELIESVWLTYGDKSGNELYALSTEETPWVLGNMKNNKCSCNKKDGSSDILIDEEDIKKYYREIYSGV